MYTVCHKTKTEQQYPTHAHPLNGMPLSQDQLPIFISGLAGIPGYNAFYYFRKKYPGQVFGIRPHKNGGLNDEGIYAANGEDRSRLQELFRRHRFKTVIDALGCCALKSCEYNHALARTVNVDSGVNLMQLSQEYSARFIRLSTDLVFDGCGAGGYVESDPVSPVTVYGTAMAEAEEIILRDCPEALVLRIPLPMGHSFNGHAGAMDWIGSRFRKNLPATLFYDEIRSNIYIQDILAVLEHLPATSHRGLFHLGGPLQLSLFQIAQIINRLGGYCSHLLNGCMRTEAGPMPPRAGNVSMDCSKLNRLLPEGMIRPWPLSRNHLPDHAEWHYERKPEYSSRFMLHNLFGYHHKTEPRHPLRYLPDAMIARDVQL